ncbi:multidrug resistance-associated protein 1-like, partial [Tropilaelaps mercedesae]
MVQVDPSVVRDDGLDHDEEIALKNATLSWTEDESPVLKDVNLSVRKGELIAVVGSVASGKSSLVQAIIGEMKPSTGSIHRRRTSRLAYVPQQAWILNNTIRRNILFDQPHQKSVYQEVVQKCCLMPDLKTLPAGDGTEIGEKGVNLSGGQKQRVSLARAVYQDADVYLLDDPLSAVDAHVAYSLFTDVIGPEGLLRDKTRLLVTHSVAILPKVDRIVILDDGRITHQGTYDDIMRSNVRLKELIETHANTEVDDIPLSAYDQGEYTNVKAEIADRVSLGIKHENNLPRIRQRTTSTASISSTGSGASRVEQHFSEIPS